jgi:hypothetical protein
MTRSPGIEGPVFSGLRNLGGLAQPLSEVLAVAGERSVGPANLDVCGQARQ